ncbi:MAG TPA: hypothetical protein VGE97_00795, partial [Nitrososphaera sp.]
FQFRKGISTPFNLVANIFCVLKWKHDSTEAKRLFMDFAECLQDDAATMVLPKIQEQPSNGHHKGATA